MRVPVHRAIKRHPLVIYFALAFLISWAAVLSVVVPTGIIGTGADYTGRGPLVFVAMLIGPSAAGLTLTALFGGRRGFRHLWDRERRWRVGRWWTAVLITPAIVAVLGLLSIGSPELTPALLTASDKGGLIALALAIGLLAGCLEDLGWTGFALTRMQDQWGWTRSGLVLGLIWGVWHLLADFWGNADAWGPLYLTRYLLWCVAAFTAYRMLIVWSYHHTGSLLLAQLMHAGFTGGQVLLAPAVTPSSSGLLWYAAFAVTLCLIVGAVIFIETRRTGHVCLEQSRLSRDSITVFGDLVAVVLSRQRPPGAEAIGRRRVEWRTRLSSCLPRCRWARTGRCERWAGTSGQRAWR